METMLPPIGSKAPDSSLGNGYKPPATTTSPSTWLSSCSSSPPSSSVSSIPPRDCGVDFYPISVFFLKGIRNFGFYLYFCIRIRYAAIREIFSYKICVCYRSIHIRTWEILTNNRREVVDKKPAHSQWVGLLVYFSGFLRTLMWGRYVPLLCSYELTKLFKDEECSDAWIANNNDK